MPSTPGSAFSSRWPATTRRQWRAADARALPDAHARDSRLDFDANLQRTEFLARVLERVRAVPLRKN
jgi:hypothetical protein